MKLCGTSEGGATDAYGSRKPLTRKVLVIGDGACGKTSALHVYTMGHFPEGYEPTIFETHPHAQWVEDQRVDLVLWDTAGQEDFGRLRALAYADTHVVMLCYSVDQPDSLANVEEKWIDEIVEYCRGVKICLVALKCDLREDPATVRGLAKYNQKPCQYEEGLNMARRIRASRYLETSARENRGIREAFLEIARVSINAPVTGRTRSSAQQGSSSCLVS